MGDGYRTHYDRFALQAIYEARCEAIATEAASPFLKAENDLANAAVAIGRAARAIAGRNEPALVREIASISLRTQRVSRALVVAARGRAAQATEGVPVPHGAQRPGGGLPPRHG